jgi:hypothetical protein
VRYDATNLKWIFIRRGYIMELVWLILIIAPFLLYEIVLLPKVCKKKIYSHINNLGGKVVDIEKLTTREQLYYVYYTLNGKSEKAIVRFNIFHESTWK